VAMAALLVANGVAPLAGGDAARYVTLAIMLTFLVGVIQLAMGLLRAGFLVNLLSHPVLAGFTSAAAIMIAASQLGGLTGLSIPRGHVHEMLIDLAGAWPSTHLLTLSIGGAAVVAGIGVRRIFPKLPVPMIIVVLGTLGSWLLGFGERGVQIVGAVPSGLPSPSFPGFSFPGLRGTGVSLGLSDVTGLLPVAVAIALVGFMESIAVAKVYASRFRYDIDADQELKALGIANIAGGFFQSFPATGGFSRTAVNVDAGARSQVAALISASVIAVTLLFLTPLFHHLPKAILSAIIIVAVLGLIDVAGARKLWHVDRRDFSLMIATFLATLVFGIEEGIIIGAGLSVAALLQQIAHPRISVLGRVPGTDQYRSLRTRPDAIVEAGVAVLRMDASLFYGNAEAFRDAARESFAAARATAPGVPADSSAEDDADATRRAALVIDCYPMNRTDSTGLHMLHEILYEVGGQGGRVYLSGVKEPLDDKLLAGGIRDMIGPERYFPELRPAVDAAAAWVRGVEPAPAPALRTRTAS